MSDLRGRLWQYFGELLSQREYEAIEAILDNAVSEAWAEGRREAVDRLRAVLPDTMELHSDYHGAGERFYRADDVDFALDAILDRVAGLNASESDARSATPGRRHMA